MKTALLAVALFALAALGCVQRLDRQLAPAGAVQTVDRRAPFLKVHMGDGSLYILSPWEADETGHAVSGVGTRYSVDRQVTATDTFTIALQDVALFETNVARPSPSVAALAVITGITAAITTYCVTNPKGCFGSCPTMYVTDGEQDVLQAEGFSASIAPSLEARDIDALYRARPRGREVQVHLVNEAYETHVVRYANVLAAPRAAGRRIFHDPTGAFWSATEPVPASYCRAPEGDCRATLAAFDGRERTSAADSTDLAARETIEVGFDVESAAPALVVASRQSLLPTYLLYQAFAYMGTAVGDWLAAFERRQGETLQATRSVAQALGGIDVLIEDTAGEWDPVVTILETGPLATDVRLVRLPATGRPVRVRLQMARGAWRIDWVALASVEQRVEPLRFTPAEVFTSGRPAASARAQLVDARAALVTFPGDRYTLTYRLPGAAQQYELFLESQGYYLEWMRQEWLAEENPVRAAGLFLDPAGSLRRLAPEFKRVEAQLDSAFWRSRYAGH